MKRLMAAPLAAMLILCGCAEEYTFGGFYLDTAVTLKYTAQDDLLTDDVKSILTLAEGSLSAYDERSEVYLINSGGTYSEAQYPMIADILCGYRAFEECFGRGVTPFCGSLTLLWDITGESPSVPTDDEIAAALALTADASDYSGSIPEGSLLDLGAGAKGYVCDLVKNAAEKRGAEEIIFSTSSSALLMSSEKRSFTTAVTDPQTGGRRLTISTESAFISTSGGYERFFEDNGIRYTHIMDIDCGRPANTDIASVTVILPCDTGNGITCDLLSTLLYIGGTEELDKYADICEEYCKGFGILVITEDGKLLTRGEIDIA